jgi:hypothetical protein
VQNDDEAALIMVAGLPKNDPLAIFYSNFGPRTRKTLGALAAVLSAARSAQPYASRTRD